MSEPSSGIVTFLFTDIEGSTKLAQAFPEKMAASLEKHNSIVKEAIELNNGYVFENIGDAFCSSFADTKDAVNAAVMAQKNLALADWDEVVIKSRMGINSGNAEWDGTTYKAYITLSRTQRIMSAAHGEQIIVSENAYTNAINLSTKDISFRDLGERRLKDLIQPVRLYQVTGKDLRSDFLPLNTLDVRQNNMPLMLTNFIGRKKEMQEIQDLFTESRLVTLTGPGGTGKTRLALKAAELMLDEFDNGISFMELASVTNPEFVLNRLASSLSLKVDDSELLEALLKFLKDKKMLLIFDNCEHVIDACASIINNILTKCSLVKILVTSRESIKITGEIIHEVQPLSLPDRKKKISNEELSAFEAVKLFIDRAVSIKSDFKVTNENAAALIQLCHHLDGIPLAIELAAARIKVLRVEDILNKLNDRFKLLTAGSRTSLPHQQTLRTLIDWSYDLLTGNEKKLFERLSVFSGGWTLEAAENICCDDELDGYDVMDIMTHLSEKSLITHSDNNDNIRFSMLESLKKYSQEKLSLTPGKNKFLRNHFKYYLDITDPPAWTDDRLKHLDWQKLVRDEIENIVFAIDNALEDNNKEVISLALNISSYWDNTGNFREGLEIYNKVIDRDLDYSREDKAQTYLDLLFLENGMGNMDKADQYSIKCKELYAGLDDLKNRTKYLNGLGIFFVTAGRHEEAIKVFNQAMALALELNDEELIAECSANLGVAKHTMGELDEAIELFEKALRITKKYNAPALISKILSNLGGSMYQTGQFEKSRKYFEEAIPILQELEDKNSTAITMLNLGNLLFAEKNFAEAEMVYEESLGIAKEYGYENIYAHSIVRLGDINIKKNNLQKAKELYIEIIKSWRSEMSLRILGLGFYGLGLYCFENKDYNSSAVLFGKSDFIFKNMEMNLSTLRTEEFQLRKNEIINLIGEKVFEDDFIRGKEMAVEEAIAFALNLK